MAILFEGDEPSDVRRITYSDLLREVSKVTKEKHTHFFSSIAEHRTCFLLCPIKLANGLQELGVQKGDTVCIYMPMIPEVTFLSISFFLTCRG